MMHLAHVDESAVGGNVQGRLADLVGGVDVGTEGDELLDLHSMMHDYKRLGKG
jgi:hypothetical protein